MMLPEVKLCTVAKGRRGVLSVCFVNVFVLAKGSAWSRSTGAVLLEVYYIEV